MGSVSPKLLEFKREIPDYKAQVTPALFKVLHEKLYIYQSYEEQLDTDLSVDERKTISINKQKLRKFIDPFSLYCKNLIELRETQEMILDLTDSEPEERSFLENLECDLIANLKASEEKLLEKIVSPSTSYNSSVIVELRAGAGGMESCLFIEEIVEMYQKYAEIKGWDFDTMDLSPAERGFREAILGVSSSSSAETERDGVYARMQFEQGVHRVQRVPETESSGRLHTSTITVAVLPEEQDVDIEIRPQDLRYDWIQSYFIVI
jgi:peptide chain release factor 1